MIETCQEIDLDLVPGQMMPVINVSQFDNGTRCVCVRILENGAKATLELGTTCRILGRRPDGTAFDEAVSLNLFQGTATFYVDSKMTVLAGKVLCELELRDSSRYRIGTLNFILNVEECPINQNTPVTDSVLPAYQKIADGLQYISGIYPPEGSYVGISAGTWHNIHSFSVPAGKWLLLSNAIFDDTREVIKGLGLAENNDPTSIGKSVVCQGASGMQTRLNIARYVDLDIETSFSIYLYSGGATDVGYDVKYEAIELV